MNVVVNPSTSSVTVISKTQKIIVNPVNSSVSIINTGPIGPGGPPGIQGIQGVIGNTGTTIPGILGIHSLASSFTTISTHNVLQNEGLILTVDDVAGRQLKFTLSINPSPVGGLQGMVYALLRDGVLIRQWNLQSEILSSGLYGSVTLIHTEVIATTHLASVYKIQIRAMFSDTSVMSFGNALNPRQLIIEDLKGSGVPGSEANVLTVDGQLLTRIAGVLAPITRANLALDTDIAAPLAAHVVAADPHPGYMTTAEDAAIMSAHVAAADPHPVYLTAAEGDTAYVNVGGDTMTGQFITTQGGNAIQLRGVNSYVSWHNAGASIRYGYLQGNANGLLLVSEAGTLGLNGVGGLTLSPFTINGYTGSTGVIVNRLVLSDSNGYIFGNYINMTANVAAGWPTYLAGQSGDNYLRWYDRSGNVTIGGQINTGILVASGKVSAYQDYSATNWTDAALVSNGNTQAAVAFYAQGYDAPYIRFYGPFTRLDLCGSAGGYYAVGGASFTNPSSIRIKENVNETLDDPILKELFWVKAKRYDRKDSFPKVMRPSPKFVNINERWVAKGRKPLTQPNREIIYIDHDCSTQDCPGTVENPCAGVRNHKTAVGLIAEEMWERFPETVSVDMDGEPEGLFLEQIAGLALGGTAALTREVVKLMERVKLLEGVN